MDDRLDPILTLTLTPGLGPTLTRRCLDALGSPQAILDADQRHLVHIPGIGHKKAQMIRREIDNLSDGKLVAREKELIEQHQVQVLSIDDPMYPRLLRHIHDPPPLLYVRGHLRDEDALGLGIVGTRRCTTYGRQQAERLAGQCAQAGLCIVSGGAYGIDAAAHRATLRVGGRTIAVLGSGLANPYPQDHIELFDAIAGASPRDPDPTRDGGGAVISELPMTTPPLPQNFPSRNRIISGLALGVLVIEAPVRSGALITARLAAEDHNREVMAVPGRADSKMSTGCHKMIREGWATLVTSCPDILDALGDAGQLLKAGVADQAPSFNHDPPPPKPALTGNLSETQRRIYESLGDSLSFDQLVNRTRIDVPTIQADLTMLELRGLITRTDGTYSQRKA